MRRDINVYWLIESHHSQRSLQFRDRVRPRAGRRKSHVKFFISDRFCCKGTVQMFLSNL